MNARIQMLDGELVVSFSGATPNAKLEQRRRNEGSQYGSCAGYSIYKGQFKFYFRKSVSENGNRAADGKPLAEPNFYGDYFQDRDWMARVETTKIEFEL